MVAGSNCGDSDWEESKPEFSKRSTGPILFVINHRVKEYLAASIGSSKDVYHA